MTTLQHRPPTIRLEGALALLLTPFQNGGAIDWSAYDAYVEWQAAQRPTGLFAVCGSSEMKWLSPEERVQLAARAVQRAGDLPVVATANLGPDPADHPAELARMADTGIAAAVLIPEASVSGDPARYRDYLLNLTEAAPCPILLYEWPQVDHHLMAPELFGELAAKGLVSGIKDTTCTVEGIQAKQTVAGEAVIYQANTPFLIEALEMGVRGIMAITSTARAGLVIRFWDAFQAKSDDVTRLHRELVFLDSLLRFNYPATAKYLVSLQGVEMALTTRWPSKFTAEAARALEAWQSGSR
jgi:4-hydroxy-tetrahydrodipicolinate synthase